MGFRRAVMSAARLAAPVGNTLQGLLVGVGLLAVPSLAAATSPTTPPADRLFRHATVWAGGVSPLADHAIAVRGGRIMAVVPDDDAAQWVGPETRTTDLHSHLVLPGFTDNHTHLLLAGLGLASPDLLSAKTREDFTRRIARYAASLGPGEWVRFASWDHERFGGTLPHRSWVDAHTQDHPLFLARTDGHLAFANGPALRLAHITRDTPDPPGGVIDRDAAGEPTGILRDNAQGLVQQVMPPPSEREFLSAIDLGTRRAVSLGVTEIHDMGSLGRYDDLTLLRKAKAQGRLHTRVYSFRPLDRWQELQREIAEHGRGDAWLRIGGVKGFVDGALGSATAWFDAPYADNPQSSGMPITELEPLRQQLIAADAAGLQIALHAIGTRANAWALSTLAEVAEKNGPRDRRSRIEHAQHLNPGSVNRFAEVGVIASMHPAHLMDDGNWAAARLGVLRQTLAYQFRSLLAAGTRVTFGSDWPVVTVDPLVGLQAALTRRTTNGANPDGWIAGEKLDLVSALRAYTAANAYAGFEENETGTLEPGKRADFVVLSENLFAIPATDMARVKVLRTVMDGEDRFVRDDPAEFQLER